MKHLLVTPFTTTLPVTMLTPTRLPRLLTNRKPDWLEVTQHRATAITVVLSAILAQRPIPHGGINE